MLLEYFHDEKLAQVSYMVGCAQTGTALVIDPARDIMPYIDAATSHNLRIEHVTETHIHADYVSGTRELAAATGAQIYLSAMGDKAWQYAFPDESVTLLQDGDVIMVGNVKIEAIHTPGHTPEHLVFMLTDTLAADQPMGFFSGDFLFVGDIGRPDLLETAAGIANTAIPGARQQFQNIQRFKELPDYLQVWPGHGAGSACGKALGGTPSTTLGYEKLFNPAFQFDDVNTFVDWLLSDQPEAPRYFRQMKHVNKIGPSLLRELAQAQHIYYNPLELVPEDALFIDTRPVFDYAQRHFPSTVNIPISSSKFNTYVGWYVDYSKPTYFIAYHNDVQQVLVELFAIGVDNVPGYFTPEILDRATARIRIMSPQEIYDAGMPVVDVRGQSEYNEEHIPGSIHIPMGQFPEAADQLPGDEPVAIHCEGGVRSQVVISLLEKYGFTNLVNMSGGLDEWKQAGLPVE